MPKHHDAGPAQNLKGHHKSGTASAPRSADIRHAAGPALNEDAGRYGTADKAFVGNISAKELSRLQSGGGQPVVVDAGRVEVAPGPTDQGIQTSAVGEAGARAVQYVGGGARPAGAIGAEDRK